VLRRLDCEQRWQRSFVEWYCASFLLLDAMATPYSVLSVPNKVDLLMILPLSYHISISHAIRPSCVFNIQLPILPTHI
jgi:hypothetical protein